MFSDPLVHTPGSNTLWLESRERQCSTPLRSAQAKGTPWYKDSRVVLPALAALAFMTCWLFRPTKSLVVDCQKVAGGQFRWVEDFTGMTTDEVERIGIGFWMSFLDVTKMHCDPENPPSCLKAWSTAAAILGMEKGYTTGDCIKAYQALLNKYHPDKLQVPSPCTDGNEDCDFITIKGVKVPPCTNGNKKSCYLITNKGDKVSCTDDVNKNQDCYFRTIKSAYELLNRCKAAWRFSSEGNFEICNTQ